MRILVTATMIALFLALGTLQLYAALHIPDFVASGSVTFEGDEPFPPP